MMYRRGERSLVAETYRQIAIRGISACQALADFVRQMLLVLLGRLGRHPDGLFLELDRHVDLTRWRCGVWIQEWNAGG